MVKYGQTKCPAKKVCLTTTDVDSENPGSISSRGLALLCIHNDFSFGSPCQSEIGVMFRKTLVSLKTDFWSGSIEAVAGLFPLHEPGQYGRRASFRV